MAQLSSVRLRARRPSAAGGARRHELTDRGSSARSHARSHAGLKLKTTYYMSCTRVTCMYRTYPRVNLFAMKPVISAMRGEKGPSKEPVGPSGSGVRVPKNGYSHSVGPDIKLVRVWKVTTL